MRNHEPPVLAQLRTEHGDEEVNDFLQSICEAAYHNKELHQHGDVFIECIERADAINMEFSGRALFKGTSYAFRIEDGNWVGTYVRQFDLEENGTVVSPQPHVPTKWTMVPTEITKAEHPLQWALYLTWRKTEWFQSMVSARAYDLRVQPGGKIEEHYKALAAKRGLRWVPESEFEEMNK